MFELILTKCGYDGEGKYVYVTIARIQCRGLVLQHLASALAAVAVKSGFDIKPTLPPSKWMDACQQEPVVLAEAAKGRLYLNITLRAI